MKRAILIIITICFSLPAFALTYNLPAKGDNLVGEVRKIIPSSGETLISLGRLYDIGVMEMREANPHIEGDKIPPETKVMIPSEFLLPDVEWEGMVINLAEMRMYYFHTDAKRVTTHPVGIGRVGWETPVDTYTIASKQKNPTWYVPKTIKADAAERGTPLPDSIGPGPDNPLGNYAMRLSDPNYLIHGTNQPEGVGTRTTAGCIRLLPEDIETLFPQVAIGTKLQIINDAIKVGWPRGKLLLEAHYPLNEEREEGYDGMPPMMELIMNAPKVHTVNIDWEKANRITEEHLGIPFVVGKHL